MMHFFRTERPRLVTDGILDANAQDEELERRWQVMQSIALWNSQELLVLDDPLPESTLNECNLVSQGVLRDATGLKFMYALRKAPEDAGTTIVDESPPRKRKRAPEDETFALRLLLNLKKDTLQIACEDLALPVSGTKETLARTIVRHARDTLM